MKAVRRPKRATAKLGTNFPGVNNGPGQMTPEIMRELRESDALQRCPSEVLSPIRSAYTISAGTFGNGVSTLTKAATVQVVAIGGCCAAAPGPQVIVSKCNLLTEMWLIAMNEM